MITELGKALKIKFASIIESGNIPDNIVKMLVDNGVELKAIKQAPENKMIKFDNLEVKEEAVEEKSIEIVETKEEVKPVSKKKK
jgi:hypothetical protein